MVLGPHELDELRIGMALPVTEKRIPQRFTLNISIAIVTLCVFALALCAACISTLSEKLYHETLGEFAQSALNSVVTRLVMESLTTLSDIERGLDTILYSTYSANRLVPTIEEAELVRSGLITPLGSSIANESSKPFSFYLGSQMPNTSLTVSTWRQYFGPQMAAIKLASTTRFTNFDVVFTDGSFLTLLASDDIDPYEPTLLDGMLVNGSYYLRKSSAAKRVFQYSTIMQTSLTDRRAESWYSQKTIRDGFDLSSPTKGWSNLYFNTTTGESWMDLVAILNTANGNIGRTRCSLTMDWLAWQNSYYQIIPRAKLQIFIVSLKNEVIFDTPDYESDRTKSLWREEVEADYMLSENERSMNCQLELQQSNASKIKICRHTVSSYGNPVLKDAWRVAAKTWDYNSFYASRDYDGKLKYIQPIHKPFGSGDESYFVSTSAVRLSTPENPKLVILVIVPESEVVGVLDTIRVVVIGITIGITLLAGMLVAIGTRFILSPLRDVASDMKHAKYLRDTDKRSARLSRWSEVRAIQESYRAMSHELKTLKAYIPENVREDVLQRNDDRTMASSSDNGPPGAGDTDQDTEMIDIPKPGTNPLEVNSSSPASDSIDVTPPEPQAISIPIPEPLPTAPLPSMLPTAPLPSLPLPSMLPTAALPSLPLSAAPQPVYFHDSCLVDRDITVVHLNIFRFHKFDLKRPPAELGKYFAEYITFIGSEAKRFGGVLEHFMGDKIWVSFNATSKCDKHQIAACYFGYYVTTVANDTSVRYLRATPGAPTDGSIAEKPRVDRRFYMCHTGINCGIATGKAFTGPLGNTTIKRHSIISNAMSESAALERLSTRYSAHNVLVGQLMLKHIEGYLHYMIFDSSCLPGSNDVTRLLATIQGPTLGPKADVSVVSKWLTPTADDPPKYVFKMERPSVTSSRCPAGEATPATLDLPILNKNIFDPVNDAFKAAMQNARDVAKIKAAEGYTAAAEGKLLYTGQLMRENLKMLEWMADTVVFFVTSGKDGKNYTSLNGMAYRPTVLRYLFKMNDPSKILDSREREKVMKAVPVKAEPIETEPVLVKAEPVEVEPVKAEPGITKPVEAEPVSNTSQNIE